MPEHSGPQWLGPLGAHPGGVDFMGLRQPGLTMADELLPGITNTTRNVRYYTVIGWLFARSGGSRDLRLLESAFVHASLAHEHPEGVTVSGVVGSQSLGGTDEGGYDTGLGRKKAPVSALDAPFYGPSAQALGVAGKTDDGKLAPSRLGKALADTVSVQGAADRALQKGHITNKLVEQLGELCFCTPASGRERDLLEEVLFRHDQPRSGDAGRADDARARSLALILHLLPTGGDPQADILQAVLERIIGRRQLDLPVVLEDTADGFGLMAMRWFFRDSVEAAWAAMGRVIHRQRPPGCSARSYVRLALEQSDQDDPWLPAGSTTLGTALDNLGNSTGLELRGHERLTRPALEEGPAAAMLSAALQLALTARHVRSIDRSTIAHASFLDLQEPWWCPLSNLAREAQEDSTIEEWLGFVLDRYVIGQHFITASRKMGDGVDGYFFHPTDDGFRLDAHRFGDEQRNWRPAWLPDGGPTKIPAAISLMSNIGLARWKGEEWRRTKMGRACVQRVLERYGNS